MRILCKLGKYVHPWKESTRLTISNCHSGYSQSVKSNLFKSTSTSSPWRRLPPLPFPPNQRLSPLTTNSHCYRRHYSNSSSPTDLSSRQLDMLVKEGFTPSQGEAIVGLLSEAIEESMQSIVKGVITKEEQKKIVDTYRQEFISLRSDIQSLSRKDIILLRGELDSFISQAGIIKDSMRGEIQKVHAGTRLDVNLEKGRVGDEREVLERKVKEADQRIDREVEGLVGRLNVIKGEMTTTIVSIMGLMFLLFVGYKVTQSKIRERSQIAKSPPTQSFV